MEKKRYVLFAYYGFYPDGGMRDSVMSFDIMDELLEVDYSQYDFFGVFDTETFKVGYREESPLAAFNGLK